jgi:hypothetical protein
MTATQYLQMLQDRRRYHLRRLFGDDESQKAFAQRLGIHHSYFCGLMMGSRAFGEKRARLIEQKCGLAFGFLDQEAS